MIHASRLATAVIVSITVFIVGCPNQTQKNLNESQQPAEHAGNGVIVGSVTAPFNRHYHETILFEYRSLGDKGKHSGVLTSGIQHGNPLIDIPTCTEADIPSQCGRLFAVSLPAGDYEIYQAYALGQSLGALGMPPMRFTVTKGNTIYLGNLQVSFCLGMRTSFRGDILGANIKVRDAYNRHVPLIRKRFNALSEVPIEKQLLPDLAWQMRVQYEPFDWKGCKPSPAIAPEPMQ